MRLAQGLGEYGMLAGGKAGGGEPSALREIVTAVEDFFRNATPTTWAMIGLGLFALWFLFLRRR